MTRFQTPLQVSARWVEKQERWLVLGRVAAEQKLWMAPQRWDGPAWSRGEY